ncbi:delta-1-pyrroline-5-carboxylate synthase-like isoform X2 [Halichondria panicea]|uniref:delta-1-pyrroline-5-carboxylate synthase-like isoform X2 n=1 Tax=Halichondria panicea TaxID=6063 RepID=UPI00312B4EA9
MWRLLTQSKVKSLQTHISLKAPVRRYSGLKTERKIAAVRGDLANSRRIVVKLGSAVITRDDECGIALGRLASIIEQVSWLHNRGKDVVVVTSGAVAIGKQSMRQEKQLSRSVRHALLNSRETTYSEGEDLEPRACAASGQVGLMTLYETMFAQYGISCAQVLITSNDLTHGSSQRNLLNTMNALLSMKVVPVLNGNDVVAPTPQIGSDLENVLSIPDNDQLAAQVSTAMNADLLVLLSDVDGLYTGPPSDPSSRLIQTYYPEHANNEVKFGGKSRVGRGGMESKLQSAVRAVEGETAVVIANGMRQGETILDIVQGKPVGTFITRNGHIELATSGAVLADEARDGSYALQALSSDQRAAILHRLADLVMEREQEIITANQKDIKEAIDLADALKSRLKLTHEKLESLSDGLQQLAEAVVNGDHVGQVIRRTLVGKELVLEQQKVPIGVLLVIFESRPDCLIQVAGLSVATANGLLLKGGKEAKHSNRYLHSLVQEALSLHVPKGAVGLVDSREEVSELLSLHNQIDLVIPRGGNSLVRSILEQVQGKIPVLGHADGICHVYLDKDADLNKALNVVVDSKCDYPAACNAVETILLHKSLLNSSIFQSVIAALKERGVVIHPGPSLSSTLPFHSGPVPSLHVEYGGLECNLEVVDSLSDAVQHINTYGSSHTDAIVTENDATADEFLRCVDSACVFHNASTRFADGYRFGLGAEVGISTGRIHARGPVGIEGLLTTKWLLRGEGHAVTDFGQDGSCVYIHQQLATDKSKPVHSETEDHSNTLAN